MKTRKLNAWLPLLLTALLTLFFVLLFFADNKYKTPPPYGKDGLISLTEAQLRDRAVFLIDGWLLTDSRVKNQPTFIGEFQSLRRGDLQSPPHGEAAYELTLRYSGAPIEVLVSFPQLYSSHTILLDGQILSQGNGGARVSFALTQGDHLLTVETSSTSGFYSGMYHPPTLGGTNTVLNLVMAQIVAYAIACFGTLTLALFSLVLWRRARDKLTFRFGLLCCFFSLYLSYYFVRLLALPFGAHWYLVQSAAFYGLCFCVLRLTALAGSMPEGKMVRRMERIMVGASALLLALAMLIPAFSWAVWLHGVITNLYFVFTFCGLLWLCLRSRQQTGREAGLTRLACAAFGIGLLSNLLASDLFEPILFFWQFEWCGLLLVGLFGAMLAARNQRILLENENFKTHLEDLVEQRTAELSNLLRERKAFFADMAHDLKAPVFATGSFIQAIREHDTGVDGELLRYIDLVEQKQQEMARRVQGLTAFNQMEEQSDPYAAVSVQELLEQVYAAHHMAAEVQSVHLAVEPPDGDGRLYAQPRKLQILYENLIVNALRVTPPGGKITLAAEIDVEGCHLSVADTGCGIPSDELPHIFNRFYVGKQNKSTGSGLGLYIVKSIVDSLHGTIDLSSTPGKGTVFLIDLPLMADE